MHFNGQPRDGTYHFPVQRFVCCLSKDGKLAAAVSENCQPSRQFKRDLKTHRKGCINMKHDSMEEQQIGLNSSQTYTML